MNRTILNDFSVSAAVAGLIALIATYSGPVLIVVQAAKAGQLSQDLLSTWIWALSVGAAVVGLWLSIRFKTPVIGAWSTPGVALLIFGLTQYPFSEVIGCYLLLAIIVTLLGMTGLFSKLMTRLPSHLLSAMIAGVLFQFCAKIFQSLQAFPKVVLPIIVVYVICRRVIPRYAVAFSLLTGLLITLYSVPIAAQNVDLKIVIPVITMPTFSWAALTGLGLPLLLLALTQYATGVTILRNAGYELSIKKIVSVSGLVSVPLSLFGSSGINPAAIVGAICASSECHIDPKRRYISGVVCGIGYIVVGIFGASVVAMFSLLPNGLIATLAGLALLGTLVSSLTSAMADEKNREPSLITFVVTVSGMTFLGLGSALWGLIAGMLFTTVLTWKGFANNVKTSTKSAVITVK
jgi:benzoate membrane transport protein